MLVAIGFTCSFQPTPKLHLRGTTWDGTCFFSSAGIACIADVRVGSVQLKAAGQERLRRAFGLVQLLSGVSTFGMLGKLRVVKSRSSIVAGASLCR